jgi:hypothetical protein
MVSAHVAMHTTGVDKGTLQLNQLPGRRSSQHGSMQRHASAAISDHCMVKFSTMLDHAPCSYTDSDSGLVQ